MSRKVERGSRGKSVVVWGGGDKDLPAAPRITSGARTPSRKREGIGAGREASPTSAANPFMPGLRPREGGWTEARTRTFLALLAQTGCVTDAARVAGISRTTVNRSRKLFAPFDEACRAALANALRGLEAVAYQRAVEGRESVVLRDGREVERRIVPSDALLALLLKRGDLAGVGGRALTAEEAEAYELPEAVRHRFLSREEFFSGITFDNRRDAGKCQRPTSAETDAEILRRIAIIESARSGEDLAQDCCRTCGQPVGEDARQRFEAKAAQAVPPRAPVWDTPRRAIDHHPARPTD